MSEKDPLLNESRNLENGRNYSEIVVIRPPGSKVKHYANSRIGCWERRRRARAKAKYYRELEELQEVFEEDRRLIDGEEEILEMERGPDRILARVLLILNICLLFANLFASIVSGSLSIISTFVDSFMDITTSLILGICLWLIKNTNYFKYPRGRSRLELLGVILCSIIMGIANMFLIMQSVTAILTGKNADETTKLGDCATCADALIASHLENSQYLRISSCMRSMAPEVNILVLAIMLSGSSIKIILMVICYKRGTASSKVLAMDMRNDIATSLVAIVCATIGDRYWSYADPVGAILVCGLIATSWFHHAIQQVPILVGVRAERDQLSRILKIVIEHDDRIRQIHHIMVYHTGLQATVELHIVMDENLPLKITHDISHPLEEKLLKLDFVERAFVHCDYECDDDRSLLYVDRN
ncbi:cation diffusion facilitator family transporter [Ancylostoma ceylanicum]|uniref:Cation diffusion facilitator family transporter n=1 Tax=Ancylostoma ceylanicum TaxID=53326 RepID=A0A0D6LB73_9BILA|nr:cation diffusion facilitator family transporter [Ancylostoma ceylanicum]